MLCWIIKHFWYGNAGGCNHGVGKEKFLSEWRILFSNMKLPASVKTLYFLQKKIFAEKDKKCRFSLQWIEIFGAVPKC
jgi:hypothetical protein